LPQSMGVSLSTIHAMSVALCILAACAWNGEAASAPRPNIVLLMIDDLGFHDTSVNNPDAPTPTITNLVNEGIRLDRHYVYMYCSPTRRSFLTGRYPVSINPNQASPCSNYVPRQFTWISDKLKAANYSTHFIGKGHLGYATTEHLPINRGYDSHVGYLGGSEDYYQATKNQHDFWHDDHPGSDIVGDVHYSTNFYTREAVKIIRQHDASHPLFIDLRYQGVHGPYEEPPIWEQIPNTTENQQKCGPQYSLHTMQSMVKVVDDGIGNVTAALKEKQMWDNTLIIFTSDNGGGAGGSQPSNNWPLRGTKAEPWEGGIRAAAFVSGGFVPSEHRGTNASTFMHIADWYPTLCNLAGVDPTDTVVYKGEARPIDGLDVWPALTQNMALDREWLPVTNQSLLWNHNGSWWKLITGAPSTHWSTPRCKWHEDGWPCVAQNPRNVSTHGLWECMVCSDEKPCLFHIENDQQERHNLAETHPNIVATMRDAMFGRNFPPYTDEDLLPEELDLFECVDAKTAKAEWWDGYSGPCCRRRSESAELV